MRIVAIDPGLKGAIAVCNEDNMVWVDNMPKGMTAIVDLLEARKNDGFEDVVIENVGGYRPGNSGPSAVKFARHVGQIESCCYTLGLSLEYVSPSKWMKGLGSFSSDKNQRKREIKEMMQRLYPGIKVTLVNADALGILTWYHKTHS